MKVSSECLIYANEVLIEAGEIKLERIIQSKAIFLLLNSRDITVSLKILSPKVGSTLLYS
jgi:hypothetical protein